MDEKQISPDLNEEEELDDLSTSGAVVPVVGIGASAGGLDVFKRLLSEMPDDTGFAIVLIQHLDPNHQSMLAGILARATAMPVTEAADDLPLQANHIYVIPANVDLTLAGGALQLTPRTQAPGTHMPIDRFFRSLADQRGSGAIGVILSGAGSDGAAGVEAINAAGGVTFAQDAVTAKVASMPQASVATGGVDFVLPPEGIVAELVRISRRTPVADRPLAQSEAGGPGSAADDKARQFRGILDILHRVSGIDFSLYREKMIKRRILRRLALRSINSLAEYSRRLENDPDEIKALQRDLLISVTGFFRDPESFAALKKLVFPRIVRGRLENDPIRIWVAGCATGEEAYSIAISLQEYLTETGAAFPVQIFASDVSLPAIEKARTGRYLESIAEKVGHERLNRYFTKIGGSYQINKNLREMCVFTRHNLIDDPPFSRLDLISCRNVLIYLGVVQKNLVSLFHYALNPAGFLLLGASEGAAASDLFSETDREHRIYARREVSRKPYLFPSGDRGSRLGSRTVTPKPAEPGDRADARKQVDRILLSKYSPASVVVDENLDVLEFRGKPGPYLTLPAGKVSFNLMKLIPDAGLFLQVEELVLQARKNGEPVRRESVPFECSGNAGGLNLEVVPLDFGPTRSALVIFEPLPEPDGRRAATPDATLEGDVPDRHVAQLKQQLADAKERFLSAVEAHQTSSEESQTATEEALSANEELQSLNEELETAKEELQSTNEELVTLNHELEVKNAALAQARDFALSIVECVRQPLLVLDTDLRIRKANRAFYQTFQVSPLEAEGQALYSLSSGSWDVAGLRDLLNGLLQGGEQFADFEAQQAFPAVGRKSLVMAGCHLNHLKMILLAVDDVTERKLVQQALRKSEDHPRQAQKMEAVGRLAGGIAHDFNNLLTGILGYSGLLIDSLDGNGPAIQQVTEIRKAGERAASLTKQLLAYSRHQMLQPKVLDLNSIVADLERMLRRVVGERIKVAIDCELELWQVRADPGEIGRAILNLALNGRDAMPAGGTLTIGTMNVTLTDASALSQAMAPGRYAMMVVHDTGSGIDAEVLSHIFEPFYTTKAVGKGTGLGLATVLGIVEQSGGAIRCESGIGEGTTFKIFLPAVVEPVEKTAQPAGSLNAMPTGTEIILLVEDEDMVRVLARKILEERGYVVCEARNGREGLTFCKTHEGPIDLLLSDVVMPELGGRELADAALQVRPGMKVLFMSGHTEDIVLAEGVKKGVAFLPKPFTSFELAQKVRETLDSAARSIKATVRRA